MNDESARKSGLEVIEQVDFLNEEIKCLALNVAIYLAKKKSKSRDLSRLEPEFVRLVNATVKVVQELTVLIGAARNSENMTWDISTGKVTEDLLEIKLRSILSQCDGIMKSLGSPSAETH